jgi:hypothetical protein
MFIWARIVLLAVSLCFCAATARAVGIECSGGSWAAGRICADPDLSALNARLAERSEQVIAAAHKKTLRALIEVAEDDWSTTLDSCRTAENPTRCLERRMRRRIDALTLMGRLLAGPAIPPDPVRSCGGDRKPKEIAACLESLFAAADTAYALFADALEVSLAAVNMQVSTGRDGGGTANQAAEAFRNYRAAACALRALSPLADDGAKGILACQTALTLRETADILALLGRDRHWSESLDEVAPAMRACLDKLRELDVELRVIDIRTAAEGERVIRVMGSRGAYDCTAIGETAAGIESASVQDRRANQAAAIFIPVAGARAPQEVLAVMPDIEPACYDVAAAIVARVRLSGWIATSRCAF